MIYTFYHFDKARNFYHLDKIYVIHSFIVFITSYDALVHLLLVYYFRISILCAYLYS